VTQQVSERIIEEIYGDADLIEGLLPLARKRWRSTDGLSDETRKRRLTGFLQRRGYNWDIIQRVLKEVSKGSPE
jgi:SOS response regulatory protein OraA/RecX